MLQGIAPQGRRPSETRYRETARRRKWQSTILREAGGNQRASFGILIPLPEMDGEGSFVLLSAKSVSSAEPQRSLRQLPSSIYARDYGTNRFSPPFGCR